MNCYYSKLYKPLSLKLQYCSSFACISLLQGNNKHKSNILFLTHLAFALISCMPLLHLQIIMVRKIMTMMTMTEKAVNRQETIIRIFCPLSLLLFALLSGVVTALCVILSASLSALDSKALKNNTRSYKSVE